jgi:hypothetical protein
VHPKFHPKTLANDIAVLELATLIGGRAMPACLPAHRLAFYRPYPATVSGYGQNDTRIYAGVDRLQILNNLRITPKCPPKM